MGRREEPREEREAAEAAVVEVANDGSEVIGFVALYALPLPVPATPSDPGVTRYSSARQGNWAASAHRNSGTVHKEDADDAITGDGDDGDDDKDWFGPRVHVEAMATAEAARAELTVSKLSKEEDDDDNGGG